MMVNHVGYTRMAFQTLGSNRKHAGWNTNPLTMPGGDVDRLIDEFLAETFTRFVPAGSGYLYKVSVAISEKLLLDDKLDGLMYPTVQMKANADNFALKPRYADNNLKFLKAEYVRINGVRHFAFDSTRPGYSDRTGTRRHYSLEGITDLWTLRRQGDQLTFSVENGEWIARGCYRASGAS